MRIDDKDERYYTPVSIFLENFSIKSIPFLVDPGAEDTIINTDSLIKQPNSNEIHRFIDCIKNDARLYEIVKSLSNARFHLSAINSDDRSYLLTKYKSYCIYGINDVVNFVDTLHIKILKLDHFFIDDVKVLVDRQIDKNILGMDILKYFHVELISSLSKDLKFSLNKNWKELHNSKDSISNISLQSNLSNLGNQNSTQIKKVFAFGDKNK